VRDGATALLERLGAKTISKTEHIVGGRRLSHTIVTGRSGGVVDAPGKKHRIAPPKAPVRPTAPDLSRVPRKGTNTRGRGRG
jgi:hypothetical protein